MNVSERARLQTQRTINRNDVGMTIRYYPPSDSEVVRDLYDQIVGKGLDYIEIKAFPTIINPTGKQIDRAGCAEYINILCEISYPEFTEKISSNPPDINRHQISINVDGIQRYYNIDSAYYKGNINSGYRYVIIAGVEIA